MHSIKAQNISGTIIETSKVHAFLNTRMTLRYMEIQYIGTMKSLLPWYSTNHMIWFWLRYWDKHIKCIVTLKASIIDYICCLNIYPSSTLYLHILMFNSAVLVFALQGIDNDHKTFWWQLFYDETNANTKTMAFSKSAVFSNVMTKTKIQ